MAASTVPMERRTTIMAAAILSAGEASVSTKPFLHFQQVWDILLVWSSHLFGTFLIIEWVYLKQKM
jgi:hypothetical protein